MIDWIFVNVIRSIHAFTDAFEARDEGRDAGLTSASGAESSGVGVFEPDLFDYFGHHYLFEVAFYVFVLSKYYMLNMWIMVKFSETPSIVRFILVYVNRNEV